MNLVADESVHGPIVHALRALGHAVAYVAETCSGSQDDEVLSMANRLEAVLFTADRDFGELVLRMGRASHGVVLLRLHGLSQDAKVAAVNELLASHTDPLSSSFTTVAPGITHVRTRKRPS